MASPFKPRRARSEDGPFHACARDYVHNLLLGSSVLNSFAYSRHHYDNRLLIEVLLPRKVRLSKITQEMVERANASHVLTATPRRPSVPGSPVANNLSLLARVFELDAAERAVLQFVLATQSSRELRELVGTFRDVSIPAAANLLAVATGIKPREGRRALRPGSRLVDSGLVSVCGDSSCDLHDKLSPTAGLIDAIAMPGLDEAQLLAWFLKPTAATTLELSISITSRSKPALLATCWQLRSQRTAVVSTCCSGV